MKFDQIIEKVDIKDCQNPDYESLIFNIEEEKVQYRNGNKYWYLNGKLHRADGPAVEFSDGSKFWYLNGECHRTDGPAIEYRNGFGNKFWYLNGKLHRADGPACEYASGNKSWWLHGKEYSEEEYEYFTRQKHI